MKTPPIPPGEQKRLDALKEYQILDTLPEQTFDDLTKIASQICGTPIALVSLIDEDRQWFKSHHGLDVQETPRQLAYCAHAINKPNAIMEIPDAYKDERFHDNPLATGDPFVRFYAGAPLTDDEGHTLGTLCVIDHKERHLTEEQREALWALSRQVVALLQLRKENLKRKLIDQDFNMLVENLGDGVFELDEHGHCTYANSKMLQMLERNLDEVLNTSIWDMIFSEDVTQMQTFYTKQFKEKVKKCQYEYRLQPKNGNPIWVSQNTTMEYEEDRMVRLRSISRDISETKAIQKELVVKESLYKLVSENSTDLIALHDPDGTYKFITPSVYEILGYRDRELIGKNPYDFIHPEDIEKLRRGPHEDTLDGDSITNIEYRLRRKDGSYIWMESYTNPITDDEGNVTSFQTSSRNISEKKEEERRINKHLQGLTLLNELSVIPSSNIILNIALQKITNHLEVDYGIISCVNEKEYIVTHSYSPNISLDNSKSYDLENTLPEEALNCRGVFIHEEQYQKPGLSHPCFDNIEGVVYIGACIIKNGTEFGTIDFISLKGLENKFSSYDKEFIQLFANWIGSILEAQEEKELLKNARKNAEAASEAKASFLSMMSHEIRTPLNGIIGTTNLLMSKEPNETQIPYLKVLEQSSNNLMSIVNDILDFEKIEEGKIQIDQSSFNLKELISSISNNYKVQGDEKGINVTLSYDKDLSDFYIGDSVRISQIIHNLLSNAIKFTDEGQVQLKLEKTNFHENFDEIKFYVKDTGIGIPEDKQKDIFEVFIQADETTTREFGGSGLGLSITKRLIELMNGEIQLESVEGLGSVFSFKLVMAKSTAESAQSSATTTENFKPLKVNILLVEDNQFNRAIAKDFLESWGCYVVETENGKEALNALGNMSMDLVLLDLQMPVMDGYETIKAIRSSEAPEIKNLPVIALTAAAMGDVESKVYQSGMDGFITKPFHPVEFYQKISSQLGNSENLVDGRSIQSIILNKLHQTLGPDEKQLDKYFDIFVQTLEEENEALKTSMLSENLITLRAYAHKNKSSLLLGGLKELAKEAEELEEMIDHKMSKPRILELATNHQRQLQNVLDQLKAI